MTCTTYCKKIEEIFDAMIRLAYEVLPENRKGVSVYLMRVWSGVTALVQSIEREEGTEELRSKFESYVAAEEARLRRNFEDIKYHIDSSDGVQLVAGEGRIEMVSEAVWAPVLGADSELSPHLGPLPDVVSRFEERFGEDQPRSKICPFCRGDARRLPHDRVYHRSYMVPNHGSEE